VTDDGPLGRRMSDTYRSGTASISDSTNSDDDDASGSDASEISSLTTGAGADLLSGFTASLLCAHETGDALLCFYWVAACCSQCNIGHRPLVSIPLCLVLPSPSSSS